MTEFHLLASVLFISSVYLHFNYSRLLANEKFMGNLVVMSPMARWWCNAFEISNPPFFPVLEQSFHTSICEVDILTVQHQLSKVYSQIDKSMQKILCWLLLKAYWDRSILIAFYVLLLFDLESCMQIDITCDSPLICAFLLKVILPTMVPYASISLFFPFLSIASPLGFL